MHEMSLAEGIRQIIDNQVAQHGFDRVTVLRLEIGRFAGVEKPALEFALDVVLRGSAAETARIEVLDLPGRALCYDCGETVQIDDRLAPCPLCGSGKLMPEAGDEMRIKDMEVI